MFSRILLAVVVFCAPELAFSAVRTFTDHEGNTLKAELTGAKEGCNNGNCGACSVIVDGRVVNACCMLAVETAGREVTTIEGLAQGDELHPLQQAFLEEAALQCGICTPGLIMSAKALLDREPHPDEHRIRFWLSGNLCRCTGYDKIVRAVQRAAGELQESK